MYTSMHSYTVSDPYCLLCYDPLFFLLGMLVVGPLVASYKESRKTNSVSSVRHFRPKFLHGHVE